MQTFLLRLWLADLPGTLGRVAGAIGSVHGDVVGIEILERGSGLAIDELTVTLPDDASAEELIRRLSAVDGVGVENMHPVSPDRSDHGILALETAARVMESLPGQRLQITCDLIQEMLEADWCAIVPDSGQIPMALSGTVTDLSWVVAFLSGADHLRHDVDHQNSPADIAWAPLPTLRAVIVCSRQRGAFRRRERQFLNLIARIISPGLVIV